MPTEPGEDCSVLAAPVNHSLPQKMTEYIGSHDCRERNVEAKPLRGNVDTNVWFRGLCCAVVEPLLQTVRELGEEISDASNHETGTHKRRRLSPRGHGPIKNKSSIGNSRLFGWSELQVDKCYGTVGRYFVIFVCQSIIQP